MRRAEEQRVDRVLSALFAGLPRGLDSLAATAGTLFSRTAASLDGGKRIRSQLVLLTHRLLGGRYQDAAIDTAAAFELLHASFLLHDDVIDVDWVRRGRPNLPALYRDEHAKPNAERVGAAAGIIAGDIALYLAHRVLTRGLAQVPAAVAQRLEDDFAQAVLVTATGELADVLAEGGPVQPTAAEEISHAKTAAYTFRGPLRAGAHLALAEPGTVEALTRFANLAGTAYQIRDDVLGVFGRPEETGKSADNDLLIGKSSTLIAHALSVAPDGLADVRQQGPDAIRGFLERTGSRRWCEERISHLTSDAIAALDGIPAPLHRHLVDLTRLSSFRSS